MVIIISIGFYSASKGVSDRIEEAQVQARAMQERLTKTQKRKNVDFAGVIENITREIFKTSKALPEVEYLSALQRDELKKLTEEHQKLQRRFSLLKRETNEKLQSEGRAVLEDFAERYKAFLQQVQTELQQQKKQKKAAAEQKIQEQAAQDIASLEQEEDQLLSEELLTKEELDLDQNQDSLDDFKELEDVSVESTQLEEPKGLEVQSGELVLPTVNNEVPTPKKDIEKEPTPESDIAQEPTLPTLEEIEKSDMKEEK